MSKNLSNIHQKIFIEETLLKELKSWKSSNQKIVFTNGVFDILHRGHIEYLAKAADFGDKFIVAINSDNSVKTLNKGDIRPIQDENSRALIIASLSFVNAVIIFNDSNPKSLISKVVPNVLVKGGDYDPEEINNRNSKYIVGSDIVKRNGGIVEVIQFVEGYSTSIIETKIKNQKI